MRDGGLTSKLKVIFVRVVLFDSPSKYTLASLLFFLFVLYADSRAEKTRGGEGIGEGATSLSIVCVGEGYTRWSSTPLLSVVPCFGL